MISAWGLTDRGVVRRENQDSCAYDLLPDYAWGVVCDGMGGAKAGDVASTMAVETFSLHMARLAEPEGDRPPDVGELLLQAAEDANRVVFHRAGQDLDCVGMGTTMVGVVVHGGVLSTVNVGDSRAYHITKDSIQRITRDHSVVEDLVAKGDLTPEQARVHPQKNLITRALGTTRTVKADLFQREVHEGEAVLLCSDGLVNEVTDDEIRQEVQAGGTPREICERLMARTLANGASDNVTIVLFQL